MEETRARTLKIIAVVVGVVLLLVSSYFIYQYFASQEETVDFYQQLAEKVIEPTKADGTINEEEVPDYSAVTEEYPGVVGWIKIPNTNVNYPVVQCADNEYYLDHNIQEYKDRRGAIYMDYRNNPVNLDSNTVIYGHNCYDGTMFSDLAYYEDISFYKKAPIIEFNTTSQRYYWKIYAVFITNASESEDNGYVFNYIYPHMDGLNFFGFVNEVNKRRLYETDVDIRPTDKMLVLSTCVRTFDTAGYRADTRLVVLARALRYGESPLVDVEKATVNPNPKYPQIYYDNNNMENPYKDDKKWYPQEVT